MLIFLLLSFSLAHGASVVNHEMGASDGMDASVETDASDDMAPNSMQTMATPEGWSLLPGIFRFALRGMRLGQGDTRDVTSCFRLCDWDTDCNNIVLCQNDEKGRMAHSCTHYHSNSGSKVLKDSALEKAREDVEGYWGFKRECRNYVRDDL